jgi:hypothetical protein
MYAKFVDYLRKLVVFSFIASVAGMILAVIAQSSHRWWFSVLLIIAIVDCLAAVPLVVEFVIQSYLEREVLPKGVGKYQFSLFELLSATTLCAVLLSCYVVFGNRIWPFVLLALVVVAYVFEARRRRSSGISPNAGRDAPTATTDPPAEITNGPRYVQRDSD